MNDSKNRLGTLSGNNTHAIVSGVSARVQNKNNK